MTIRLAAAVASASFYVSNDLGTGTGTLGWLEFIAAIAKAAAWPAVAVVAISVFQDPLSLVIRSLRSLKFRDAELRFEEKLGKAEDESIILQPEPKPADLPDAREPIKQTAVSSEAPEEQITHDWYSVRRANWELAKRSGMASADRLKPLTEIRWLEEHSIIDSTAARLLRELKHLRDMAKSGQGVLSIDFDQAERFRALSARMISTLDSIKPSPQGTP